MLTYIITKYVEDWVKIKKKSIW